MGLPGPVPGEDGAGAGGVQPVHGSGELWLVEAGSRDLSAHLWLVQGVKTEFLKSVFPAESFPAWQTIQTGDYNYTYFDKMTIKMTNMTRCLCCLETGDMILWQWKMGTIFWTLEHNSGTWYHHYLLLPNFSLTTINFPPRKLYFSADCRH